MYGRDLVEVVVPISSRSSISPFASKEKLDVVSSISPFAAAKEGRLRHQPDSALALWFHDRVKRNGGRPARTGLQHEARDADSGYWRIDGRHAGLRRILARPNQPRADDLRTSSDARGARFSKFCRADPPNPGWYRCARDRDANRERSHTAWTQSGPPRIES